MKKRIIIIELIIIIFVILIIGIGIYSSNQEIKSIKSEQELYKIYNSDDYPQLTLIERILTLPFSILYRSYGRYDDVVEWGTSKDYDLETNETTTTGDIESKDYSQTNIQVEGVDEADIIKTDGDYIYSMSKDKVIITNVKDEKNIKIEAEITKSSAIPIDLILYEDKLVVIYTNTGVSYNNKNTIVEIYNIKDKTNPKKIKSFELYEKYNTTRCIDGNLMIFSTGRLREKNKKIERKYKEDNNTKEIPLKEIKYLKNNISNVQTLIAEVNLNKITDIKLSSYLIDVSNSYISKENIYLLKYGYIEKIDIKSLFSWKGVIGFFEHVSTLDERTQIYKFHIDKKKGITYQANTKIEGETINQYSLDEKDGNLRIALETDEGTRVAILDKKLKLLGETEKVAEGEIMYASRFIGDKAYLVTYQNTDPLFVIDLTNVKKPKVLGELKIPGYSTYLHPYDENHLIGIGVNTEEVIIRDSDGDVTDEWVSVNGMKMCLFDVSDINNPKEMAKTTIGDSRTVSAILTNPKALLFSKEKNLLAIPVNNYQEDVEIEASETYEEEIEEYRNYNDSYVSEGYFVYNINLKDGFTLKGIITHEKANDNRYYYQTKLLRGLYIENNLYTVSENYIKVNSLNDLKEISSLKIENKGEK